MARTPFGDHQNRVVVPVSFEDFAPQTLQRGAISPDAGVFGVVIR